MEKMSNGENINKEEQNDRKKLSIRKNSTGWDLLITGEIIVIGLAETAHLAASFLNWPFTRCAILFWGLAAAAAFAAVLGFFLIKKHPAGAPVEEQGQSGHALSGLKDIGAAQGILGALFAAMFLSQLFFACGEGNHYRQGDMTVETVGSFLASDGIYVVNPMTGLPYTEGLPSRLKILCLPTLYGSLCKITSLSPGVIIWGIMPAVTLFSCYAAFASLGNCLFAGNGNRVKRLCFMVSVSLLLWAGAYMYGMDGFGVLYCGWRGTAIRNGVLVPWLLSLCLRKKWPSAVLCVLAEACIVWTVYGMGVCLFVLAGMLIAGRLASLLRLGD